MESVPLIPKAKALPNLDTAPLIRELFQDEFQIELPTEKCSQNILRSLQHEAKKDDTSKPRGKAGYSGKYTDSKKDIRAFTENVLKAYSDHRKKLQEIKDVEKHLFEMRAHFLNREKMILENPTIRDFICLKRQPLFKAINANYVKKYKLLQGDAGLPLEYEAKSDFRVQKFKEWRRKLESHDDLCVSCCEEGPGKHLEPHERPEPTEPPEPQKVRHHTKHAKVMITQKLRRNVQKKNKTEEKPSEIFATDPKLLFFTNFKLGYAYIGDIKVKNTSPKPVQFQLRPMGRKSPFKVTLTEKLATALSPGLIFQLIVEFTPQSLDNAAEDITLVTEDGNRFLIPLIAYLEPPILKTHKELNEYTKVTSEKIASSYIECGSCFTGDSKVIKLNFRCYRGCGEFFIMSSENWSSGYINTVTFDNLLEIPPFRVYPVFFSMERDQVIELFVEFTPKHSGMQVENIIIACDNGQMRSLDIIGDAVGWHSYYFSFQDTLLKDLSVDEDDDVKVKYYLDFGDTAANSKVEKIFCVSNNSDMAFEFQWKIREANILSNQKKYLKLSKYQVKIDPENGTFEPKSIWEFQVTLSFNNADIGNYRMVLSLYVLNLPYQCIEEDNTIIQPTGLVRNLYSQSLYGEEETSALSPELTSLQGTYESLQESIKSYMEFQHRAQAAPRQDFCRTVCALNPNLCAKPLKKSKTLFNIGETFEDMEGAGFGSRQLESNSESCTSNRDDKVSDISPQRNEVIWDFVDILVDEVELWAEVVPTRVTLQPSVIEIHRPIDVNGSPVYKEVRIINHNRSPVTCSWLQPEKCKSEKQNFSENTKASSVSFSLLFDKNSISKVQTDSPDGSEDQKLCASDVAQSEEDVQQSEEFNLTAESRGENYSSNLCEITIKPWSEFMVPGFSELTCKIEIVAWQPGKINETFWLNVNEGDLQLKMIVTGLAVMTSIETSPYILDFGALKQGTRYTSDFTITNQCAVSAFWKINHYKFDFKEGKFVSTDVQGSGIMKKANGFLAKKGNSTNETFSLDARVPGYKFSLLEVEETTVKHLISPKHYILVLGDVKVPNLRLSAPRFENAILAPSQLYVGQKHSTKVTITNQGIVETFLTWGHPFGCHCRKIKVEISPKSCRIEKKHKLTVSIDLTALEEGIISHCYIPCFFCRSAEPLILSIVGVARNVNVTFEVIDYPMQNHADPTTFKKSPFFHTILRIPWPVKMYNPTLGLKYLTETDVINMNCHCQDVEEDVSRAFNEPKQYYTRDNSEKSTRSVKSLEISDSVSVKSKTSFGKSSSKVIPEEVSSFSDSTLVLGTLDSKKSEENSLSLFSYAEPSAEAMQLNKSHLEFLNVPFRTATIRQFIIRNESPVETNFQITVLNYGLPKKSPDKRLEIIKNRVFGHSNDEFQGKLLNDQPLLFEVKPSEGDLKAYDAVCINVYCYGNTWGEYRDYLICQLRGIEPFHLKMFVQIVGHPLYFPIFKTNSTGKAALRFQPLSPVEKAASKEIKVVNRSAIPLSISWVVFLTKPLPKMDEVEDFDLCVESNASFESSHSDADSTQSSKNYIPKNTSDTAKELKDLSQSSKGSPKGESFTSLTKMEKKESGINEKKNSALLSVDEVKSDTQFQYPGVFDVHTFQVNPKEMSFEPFEEKKIKITFNPDRYRSNPQEIKGILAGCVKLKPEHESCPGLYYRPCGMNFVSELMEFTAAVEFPLVSFEILKGDLVFIVDSNSVITSQSKDVTILRKFFIKNLNQKSLPMKIRVVPGRLFQVKRVSTTNRFYSDYNPTVHALQLEGGHILEIELQCTVSYKAVMQAFEQLKMNRLKETCTQQITDTKRSNISKSSNETDVENEAKREPWKHYNETKNAHSKRVNMDYFKLGHNDSFHINVHRMSSRSDNSTCYDFHEGKSFSPEFEGEFLELPCLLQVPCKTEGQKHVVVSKEEITFVHSGSITQTLVAELHISFPAIKISPKCLDFGNVYLGETAVRYCSFINKTGFPINFRVLAKFKGAEFVASPLTGSLPPANYNSDIGKTITVKFTPTQPGYYKEIFYVYCNLDLEFDFFELFVSGFGTWNEKYKAPKYEFVSKVEGFYSKR